MEELVLTTPVVEPQKVTTKYSVISLLMSMEVDPVIVRNDPNAEPGLIVIDLIDNLKAKSQYRYVGKTAENMIRTLNTANLTTKSLHKRVLEQLSKDGFLPGTVTGTPDPVTPAARVGAPDGGDEGVEEGVEEEGVDND